MEKKQAKLLNGVALAYIGDAIYELYVREFLILKGITRPNQLHRRATHYVSAKAQAKIFEAMQTQEMLTSEELELFKRGRNAQTHTKAKNTDSKTYAVSTGFEAVLGFLYLSEQKERLDEVIHFAFEQIGEVAKYDPK